MDTATAVQLIQEQRLDQITLRTLEGLGITRDLAIQVAAEGLLSSVPHHAELSFAVGWDAIERHQTRAAMIRLGLAFEKLEAAIQALPGQLAAVLEKRPDQPAASIRPTTKVIHPGGGSKKP